MANSSCITREGAADRKNGIVIASLEDPAHPKVIAEFTEGVTGGVHSAFVYKQEKYGTHVYLTNNGTGALHVIDISDPYNPEQVGSGDAAARSPAARCTTSMCRTALLYASNWNDGLVVLESATA